MKILYIDLNYIDHFEDYSYTPRKYGGGRIVAGALLEKWDNFYIAADPQSFQNVKPEKLDRCINLTWDQREAIKNGIPVKDVIYNAHEFNLFVHHFSYVHLNLNGLKAQQVVWPVGFQEQVHQYNRHVALFNQRFQQPILLGNHKIYDVTIGPPMPPTFVENKKDDYIFQCTRHVELFNSITVAEFCKRNGIKCVFAGPIGPDYPLMKHIDNQFTFYLGEVSEDVKTEYAKGARAITQFQQFPTPVTLAAKHAMSHGAFVMAIPVGEWPYFINNGVNGFLVRNEAEFVNAWQSRKEINQQDCYNSVIGYSEEEMIKSFEKCFNEVVEYV